MYPSIATNGAAVAKGTSTGLGTAVACLFLHRRTPPQRIDHRLVDIAPVSGHVRPVGTSVRALCGREHAGLYHIDRLGQGGGHGSECHEGSGQRGGMVGPHGVYVV